jgi:hypothetical protein
MTLVRNFKFDLFIIIILFACAFTASYKGGNQISYKALVDENNVWFQADTARVYSNLTDRGSNHYRTSVHPLFSLATNPIITILNKAGLEKQTAVKLFNATLSSLWLVMFYFILRLLNLRKIDAFQFTLLASVSSSLLFWGAVPETFMLGSLSILVVTAFTIASNKYIFKYPWFILISATSMVATVTNWMAGIIATFVNFDLKRGIRISFDALIILTLLSAIQHYLYPSSSFFLFFGGETRYIMLEEAGSWMDKLRVFFFSSIIMPDILINYNESAPEWPALSIQLSKLGSVLDLRNFLNIVWAGIFCLGSYALVKWNENKKAKMFIMLFLAGQLVLHIFYGDETFLYSMHWVPFLIIIAAMGVQGRFKNTVRVLTLILIVGAGFNNIQQFIQAKSIVDKSAAENVRLNVGDNVRENFIKTQVAFPDADWPKGVGHVLLAQPGSKLVNKGYHEPGGSFSPGFGTFGIIISVFDSEGALIESSNSVPLSALTQKLSLTKNTITTSTEHYTSEWLVDFQNKFTLNLAKTKGSETQLAVRITSSGPAGSAIQQIRQDGKDLIINDSYRLSFSDTPQAVFFGDERVKLHLSNMHTDFTSFSDDGYNSATVISSHDKVEVNVECLKCDTYSTNFNQTSNLIIDSNLPEFKYSLDAQIFHLKAGIVGNETRPGDPGNYPINWLRDGAYVIAALARTGDISLAKTLVSEFASNDFFGGFGAEADAPGLAIWAIYEVSIRDTLEYQQAMWPDIERKAELILDMIYSHEALSKVFSGPIVPSVRNKEYDFLSTISKPAVNGLITGKMDNHFPIFYVNAVSYLGLEKAAFLASKLGHIQKSKQYLAEAKQLRENWERELGTHPDSNNTRTLISGIYPSNIVNKKSTIYSSLLEKNWEKWLSNGDRKVLWTYFDVAEAHQWLLLHNSERAWQVLNWFWENQTSSGLYTWWEGNKEENSFNIWPTVRGWAKPKLVTPHYWTAAEVLLLQLDMLAYEEMTEQGMHITLGLGVTEAMLADPIKAEGLMTSQGMLSWNWDGVEVNVTWAGTKQANFSLGANFPNGTLVSINKL